MRALKNQQGFGTIGLIAVIVVLAGICGAGYSVWHSKQSSKTSSPTNSAQSSSQQKPDTKNAHLFVKEWGTSFDYNDKLGTIGYKFKSSGDSITLTSALEDTLPANCPKGVWGITRTASGKLTDMDGKTISDDEAVNTDQFVKLGNYLFHFNYPQLACSDNATEKATEAKVNANYRQVLGL